MSRLAKTVGGAGFAAILTALVLQWLSRTHPDLREICDRAITALIIQGDKLRKYEPGK